MYTKVAYLHDRISQQGLVMRGSVTPTCEYRRTLQPLLYVRDAKIVIAARVADAIIQVMPR